MIDYHTTHKVDYVPGKRQVYADLPVCEYLKGTKWDELALAAVSTLRPSSIRVTTGEIKCDGAMNRVTVYVDDQDIIRSIEMEVVADVEEDIQHGHALNMALRAKCPALERF